MAPMLLGRLLPLLARQAGPNEWLAQAATACHGSSLSIAAALTCPGVHVSSTSPQACMAGMHTSTSQQHAASSRKEQELQPTSPAFTVQVAIKAFEQRYLNQASTTMADLMFVHFAPKSASSQTAGGQMHAPSNLVLPPASKRVPLNWKKTRFTIVKSPHIDKTGQEAFEMRKYKAVATVSTPSAEELQWFLDSVRLYQFPGVQIQVLVTNNGYLTPTQLNNNPAGGLLSEHRQHIARYLGTASPAADQQQQQPAQEATSLRDTLRTLRHVMYAGFQNQRQQLGRSLAYSNWHNAQKVSSSASLTAPEPSDVQGSLGTDHMQPDAHGSKGTNQAGPLSEQARQAAAFLAAADAALIGINLQSLEGFKNYRHHFATFRVGKHELPAAEWMQAVLQASQAAAAVEAASKETELQAAYASYSLFAHSLLSSLFKLWVQQTSAQLKPHLALPSQELISSFMQQPMRK